MKKAIEITTFSAGLFYLFSIFALFYQGDILLSFGADNTFYIIVALVTALPILDSIISGIDSRLKRYPSAAFVALLLIFIVMDFEYFIPLLMQLISLFLVMRYILTGNARWKYHFGYILFIVAIFFISSLARIVLTENIPQIYVFSFTDDANLLGIPLIFLGGITISSPLIIVFSISIQFTVILMAIGFFLIENYHEIASISKNNRKGSIGIISMSFTLLSCQCETISSVIPAFSAELLGLISTPLILESLALTSGTFILIRRQKKGIKPAFFDKMWNLNPGSKIMIPTLILLLILSPIFITLVSILGLQSNLFIYILTNLGVFLISFLLFLIFEKLLPMKALNIGIIGKIIVSIIIAASMIIWYLPTVVFDVTSNGLEYGLMGVVSFISGFLLFLITRSMEKSVRSVTYEFVTGMVPTVFAIIFYFLAVTNTPIWLNYSLSDQLIFTLSVLGVTLIPMWISVNYSIYSMMWHNKS